MHVEIPLPTRVTQAALARLDQSRNLDYYRSVVEIRRHTRYNLHDNACVLQLWRLRNTAALGQR